MLRTLVGALQGLVLVLGLCQAPALRASSYELRLVTRVPEAMASDTASGSSRTEDPWTRRPVTADGRYVVFVSDATNLVPGQTGNRIPNVYLRDRISGTTWLASRSQVDPSSGGNDASSGATVSDDGRWVAFVSLATDLIDGQVDTNGETDVYLFDRQTGSTSLVSRSASDPQRAANGQSLDPSISANGERIAFASTATDLLAGLSGPTASNVYSFEIGSASLTLITHAAGAPNTRANQHSGEPALSANGRWLAFTSDSRDLIAGLIDPTGGVGFLRNVYLADLDSGTVELVSHQASSPLALSPGASDTPTVSADGRHVAYSGGHAGLVAGMSMPPFGGHPAILFERQSGSNRVVSHVAGQPLSSISAPRSLVCGDGSRVIYSSGSAILAFDVSDGAVTLVSHAPGSPGVPGTQRVFDFSCSADGRQIVFAREREVVGSDILTDILLFDESAADLRLISHASASPDVPIAQSGWAASIAAGGDVVVYTSTPTTSQDLVRDANLLQDVVSYSISTDTNAIQSLHAASLASSTATTDIHLSVWGPTSLSRDGNVLAFTSRAPNLTLQQVDPETTLDVFRHAVVSGDTSLVSHRASAPGTAIGGWGWLAEDGSRIVWTSAGSDVLPGGSDLNQGNDLFSTEGDGSQRLLSHAAGSPLSAGDSPVDRDADFAGSADGRIVAFAGRGTNYLPGPIATDATLDVFVSTTTGVSGVGAPPLQGIQATRPMVSGDGNTVIFTSSAGTTFLPGFSDPGGAQLFAYRRDNGTFRLVSHQAGAPLTGTLADAMPLGISTDGRFVLFLSMAPNLVDGQSAPTVPNIFLGDLGPGTTYLVSHVGGNPLQPTAIYPLFQGMSADASRVLILSAGALSGRGGETALGYELAESFGDHLFLYDHARGSSVLVDHKHDSFAHAATGGVFSAAISRDGLSVVYSATSSGIVPGVQSLSNESEVYLYDVTSAENRLVTHLPGLQSLPLRASSHVEWTLSDRGRRIALNTDSPRLDPHDRNGQPDLFLAELRPRGRFFTVPPCRLVDSRLGLGMTLSDRGERLIRAHDRCAISREAVALAANVTVTGASANGALRLGAGNDPEGLRSLPEIVQFEANKTRANNSILPLATNGAGTVLVDLGLGEAGTVEVIVDVVGYFD